jgi:uncharacterized membrane protein
MSTSWRTEWPSVALLIAMCTLSAIAWGAVPDRMAVHWGPAGIPDRFGGRAEGLLTVPAIAGLVYGLMLVLPRFDPLRANYARFTGAYAGLRAMVVAFMAGLHAIIIGWTLGARVSMLVAVPLLSGLLLAGLGVILGRLQPTWFVGIRTPWTLSSQESWTKTHRLGGRLFIAMGLAIALLALRKTAWVVPIMVGLLLGVTTVLVVYSYVVWKRDPHRTGGGAEPGEHV